VGESSVLAHPDCPGQNSESCKMVACLCGHREHICVQFVCEKLIMYSFRQYINKIVI